MRILAGVALAGAGLYGAYKFATTGHPWMAFLIGGGALGWGAQIAMGMTPATPASSARFSGGTGSLPS